MAAKPNRPQRSHSLFEHGSAPLPTPSFTFWAMHHLSAWPYSRTGRYPQGGREGMTVTQREEKGEPALNRMGDRGDLPSSFLSQPSRFQARNVCIVLHLRVRLSDIKRLQIRSYWWIDELLYVAFVVVSRNVLGRHFLGRAQTID